MPDGVGRPPGCSPVARMRSPTLSGRAPARQRLPRLLPDRPARSARKSTRPKNGILPSPGIGMGSSTGAELYCLIDAGSTQLIKEEAA